MPEIENQDLKVKYIGTITFNPNYDLDKKNKLINRFEEILTFFLPERRYDEYYLRVAKEYHKVDGKDDYEAPHLHFILECKNKIAKYRVGQIQDTLQRKYGRSQFYRCTELKYISYKNYIYKDVQRHLKDRGESTYYEKYVYPDEREHLDKKKPNEI